MAARKTRTLTDGWKAYVYILHHEGEVLYVGKGTGRRLVSQMKAFCLSGYEVCRFESENHAYQHERILIANSQPRLNKHPGGNGNLSSMKKNNHFKEIEKIGTKAYAAKILLWWHHRWSLFIDPAIELKYWKVFNGCAN